MELKMYNQGEPSSAKEIALEDAINSLQNTMQAIQDKYIETYEFAELFLLMRDVLMAFVGTGLITLSSTLHKDNYERFTKEARLMFDAYLEDILKNDEARH